MRNDTCLDLDLSRLRTQLVRQAFQLPTIDVMELINLKMNRSTIATRIVNGKEVPIRETSICDLQLIYIYRVDLDLTLTPALIQAYQETWILDLTKLVEITNGMLNFPPYRSRREPPESTPERKEEALITYGPT